MAPTEDTCLVLRKQLAKTVAYLNSKIFKVLNIH